MNTVSTASLLYQTFEPSNREFSATVVLQPCGCLGSGSDSSFGTSLSQALEQADEVIVDLLWVDTVGEGGIALLLKGMEKAKALDKLLYFLSMDVATRTTLDAIWEQQRELEATVQSDLFMPDFEQFLDTYKEEQRVAMLTTHPSRSAR